MDALECDSVRWKALRRFNSDVAFLFLNVTEPKELPHDVFFFSFWWRQESSTYITNKHTHPFCRRILFVCSLLGGAFTLHAICNAFNHVIIVHSSTQTCTVRRITNCHRCQSFMQFIHRLPAVFKHQTNQYNAKMRYVLVPEKFFSIDFSRDLVGVFILPQSSFAFVPALQTNNYWNLSFEYLLERGRERESVNTERKTKLSIDTRTASTQWINFVWCVKCNECFFTPSPSVSC